MEEAIYTAEPCNPEELRGYPWSTLLPSSLFQTAGLCVTDASSFPFSIVQPHLFSFSIVQPRTASKCTDRHCIICVYQAGTNPSPTSWFPWDPEIMPLTYKFELLTPLETLSPKAPQAMNSDSSLIYTSLFRPRFLHYLWRLTT